MDNSNNSNWPNNPNPTSNGVPPVTPDPLNSNPFSNPAPISDMPSSAPATVPTSTPSNPWDNVPAAVPTNTPSIQAQAPVSNINPWDLPAQNPMPQTTTPVANNPWDVPITPQQNQTNTDPLASMPQSAPLPVNPDPVTANPIPSSNGTPLDNSWNHPAQPAQTSSAPIESSSTPTWLPNPPSQAPQMPQPTEAAQPMSTTPPPSQSEPAPTDLSHLLSGNQQSDTSSNSMPHTQSPETLVVPPTTPEASSSLPMENHKDIPKWLIGVGVGLLIIVTGASAYFILGVGQPPKTTSLPATQETATQQTIRNVAPAAVASTAPAASQSATTANFGQLEGAGATDPTTNQQATSAADLLRQRQ